MLTEQNRKTWRSSATDGSDGPGAMGRKTSSSVEVCLLGINECVGKIISSLSQTFHIFLEFFLATHIEYSSGF